MTIPKQRRHWLFVALLVVAGLGPGSARGVMVGKPAPDFSLPSTTGENISLSQFRGKKMVLIEFYAINFGST